MEVEQSWPRCGAAGGAAQRRAKKNKSLFFFFKLLLQERQKDTMGAAGCLWRKGNVVWKWGEVGWGEVRWDGVGWNWRRWGGGAGYPEGWEGKQRSSHFPIICGDTEDEDDFAAV